MTVSQNKSIIKKTNKMKKQSLNKHVAFIIALMLFSLLPEFTEAQTVKKQRCLIPCRPGYICIGGYCRRWSPFVTDGSPGNEAVSISSANSNAISFQLLRAQKVSAKIYDATGSLVKTIADGKMSAGNHQIQWAAKDETGNAVQAGVYFLRMDANNSTGAKKILMVR